MNFIELKNQIAQSTPQSLAAQICSMINKACPIQARFAADFSKNGMTKDDAKRCTENFACISKVKWDGRNPKKNGNFEFEFQYVNPKDGKLCFQTSAKFLKYWRDEIIPSLGFTFNSPNRSFWKDVELLCSPSQLAPQEQQLNHLNKWILVNKFLPQGLRRLETTSVANWIFSRFHTEPLVKQKVPVLVPKTKLLSRATEYSFEKFGAEFDHDDDDVMSPAEIDTFKDANNCNNNNCSSSSSDDDDDDALTTLTATGTNNTAATKNQQAQVQVSKLQPRFSANNAKDYCQPESMDLDFVPYTTTTTPPLPTSTPLIDMNMITVQHPTEIQTTNVFGNITSTTTSYNDFDAALNCPEFKYLPYPPHPEYVYTTTIDDIPFDLQFGTTLFHNSSIGY